MRSVVLCGSRRYRDAIHAFASRLRELGVDVYEPDYALPAWDKLAEGHPRYVTLGVVLDHFRMMRQADVVFVYNEDGYAGYSTTQEIGYAAALDKTIYALAMDPEPSREVLIRRVVPTPEELVKLL